MAAIATPALTVGFGLTIICLLAVAIPQEPPALVNVNVTGVVELAAAV